MRLANQKNSATKSHQMEVFGHQKWSEAELIHSHKLLRFTRQITATHIWLAKHTHLVLSNVMHCIAVIVGWLRRFCGFALSRDAGQSNKSESICI